MERLGLLPLIQEAGAVPNEIDMWTRWGWIRTPGGLPHGYNIRRETLDPMLRRLATDNPGLDFMPGKSANLLLREGGNGTGRVSGVAIRDRTGNTQEIYARLPVPGPEGGRACPAGRRAIPRPQAPRRPERRAARSASCTCR